MTGFGIPRFSFFNLETILMKTRITTIHTSKFSKGEYLSDKDEQRHVLKRPFLFYCKMRIFISKT